MNPSESTILFWDEEATRSSHWTEGQHAFLDLVSCFLREEIQHRPNMRFRLLRRNRRQQRTTRCKNKKIAITPLNPKKWKKWKKWKDFCFVPMSEYLLSELEQVLPHGRGTTWHHAFEFTYTGTSLIPGECDLLRARLLPELVRIVQEYCWAEESGVELLEFVEQSGLGTDRFFHKVYREKPDYETEWLLLWPDMKCGHRGDAHNRWPTHLWGIPNDVSKDHSTPARCRTVVSDTDFKHKDFLLPNDKVFGSKVWRLVCSQIPATKSKKKMLTFRLLFSSHFPFSSLRAWKQTNLGVRSGVRMPYCGMPFSGGVGPCWDFFEDPYTGLGLVVGFGSNLYVIDGIRKMMFARECWLDFPTSWTIRSIRSTSFSQQTPKHQGRNTMVWILVNQHSHFPNRESKCGVRLYAFVLPKSNSWGVLSRDKRKEMFMRSWRLRAVFANNASEIVIGAGVGFLKVLRKDTKEMRILPAFVPLEPGDVEKIEHVVDWGF